MTEPPKKRLCGEMSWPVVRDCKTKAVMCGKHMYVAIPFGITNAPTLWQKYTEAQAANIVEFLELNV
jgi:hypothetical protein